MISISHAVISQSHISITETREVILDSTHFCPVWLAIWNGVMLWVTSSIFSALWRRFLKCFSNFMDTFKLRIRPAVQLGILALIAPPAKTQDSDPTVTWDLPSHANNKWIISHISVLSNDAEREVHCVFVYIFSKFLRKSGMIACQYTMNPS